MTYIRRLPSGLWQATVRGRDGRRHTKTHKLKSVVKEWGRAQEALISRGDFRDPRLGEIRVAEWHDRLAGARGGVPGTRAKQASLWRTHCEAEWASWQMAAITRMEAQAWVDKLRGTRRARHKGKPVTAGQEVPTIAPATIHDIVHLMSQLYVAAMREHPPVVVVNPFASLALPRIEPRAVEFYERDEAAALYAAAEDVAGQDGRAMIELGMQVGLRFGELAGLHGHRVDWLRGKIQVIDVVTRHGLRQWPKSKRSHRVVPVPADVLERMSLLMAGRERDALVFTSPAGGIVTDGHFRNRVWYPAVKDAGIRRFPPRVMRHTAASWLVQDGVPLYDVQALLGHEDYATTQRYAHLAPDAHGKVVESFSRAHDARVTHDSKEGRSS
ncbi:MAG: site-specific integrase [Actinobacteria bacterium]|nr:site-specific integrase [Actinomycetota bacterium]